ncbi:chloride channel protein [Phyllobacterium endophyticum]|uniref:chloride channel protein n=1 Tax=Phyllobacterium endophyticum TaxID=1149773 RepID=UPI0011C91D91|nr:chloride channel protein [Phyllobacterium endophyticum]TXR46662.1 chloride channel protein [Phyllobacterium endophyticum]
MPHNDHSPRATPELGDFSTDYRVLVLVAMAFVVGTGSAFAAWLLLKLIALATNLAWFHRFSVEHVSYAELKPSFLMLIVPVLGGLIIGVIARYGSEKIRGHGIPEAIEAILIGSSRMQPKVAILKPLSSAIAIGTGGPFGAEGPIIMTGGAIGSLFAQCFHLSAAERKTMLVAGAAGGMTAVFGTPIAAVLLAVELLLFEWKPRSLIPVMVAAVVAVAWRPLLLGAGPLFPLLFNYDISPGVLLLCAVVGLSMGLLSGLLTALLYAAEDMFLKLPIHWMWWPAIGGLAIGLGGLVEPRAMGVGYDVIHDLLVNSITAQAVLVLVIVKCIIWIVALASGTSGGVLAPLLIIGGAAGFLEGQYFTGPVELWSLLGMAAMMGGTMRSPLTGIIFAVELTGKIELLVPVLVATGCSYAVTVLLLKRSILTEKIARRGQHLTREYSVDPYEWLRVSEVMVASPQTLPSTMSIDAAINLFKSNERSHKSYPLVDHSHGLVGMVSRADILRWSTETGRSGETLFERVSDNAVLFGYPDEVLARLADRMVANDAGRVPIIDRQTRKVIGLVARKDLLKTRLSSQSAEKDRAAYFRKNKTKNRGTEN